MTSSDENIRRVMEYAPDLKVCVGWDGNKDPMSIVDRAIALGAYKVQLFKPYFNQESIDKAHANGILCNVFWADDPDEAQKYFEMGIDTVLTSGGAGNCTAGIETIGHLLALRDEVNGPEVLIGAGVNAKVIAYFREHYPLCRSFHMSGKADIPSAMVFRREGVPMGIPGFDEWHIQQTSEEAVRLAKEALHG